VKAWFKTVVETPKRQETFLENGKWIVSPEFSALAYVAQAKEGLDAPHG